MYLRGGHCFRLWDSWNCKITRSRNLANPPLKASTFVLTTETQRDQRILTSSSSNTAALSVALSFKLSCSTAPCCISTGTLSLSLSQHVHTHKHTPIEACKWCLLPLVSKLCRCLRLRWGGTSYIFWSWRGKNVINAQRNSWQLVKPMPCNCLQECQKCAYHQQHVTTTYLHNCRTFC